MTGYTKLFNSILGSTIWREDPATKVVWITLLALTDRDGIAESSVPGLANYAGVGIEETEKALQKFQSPDPYSRTPEFEGRRIEPIDGGWRILNHDKYRFKPSADDIRERDRIRKQKQRDRAKCPTESGTKCDITEMSEKSDIQKADSRKQKAESKSKNTTTSEEVSDVAEPCQGISHRKRNLQAVREVLDLWTAQLNKPERDVANDMLSAWLYYRDRRGSAPFKFESAAAYLQNGNWQHDLEMAKFYKKTFVLAQ